MNDPLANVPEPRPSADDAEPDTRDQKYSLTLQFNESDGRRVVYSLDHMTQRVGRIGFTLGNMVIGERITIERVS